MDLVLWIGGAAITANFVTQAIRTMLASRRFAAHLAERHPTHYEQIYVNHALAKAFTWPFTKRDNAVVFMMKSSEDFGDPRVRALRATVKRHFLMMIASILALPIWFLAAGLVLPKLYRYIQG